MKDFKLRAWHKKQKRMFPVYGIGKDFITEDTLDGVDPGTNCFSGEELEDIEVMQYIGIKNEKGSEICEGDIVVLEKAKCIVKFDIKDGSVAAYPIADNAPFVCSWGWNKMEIIGNIHENPELLK